MNDTFTSSRRKDQARAEAIAKKARSNSRAPYMTDAQLWREVIRVLDDTEHLRRVMGHYTKIADVVLARQSVEELRLRGVQQQLPI